MTSQTPPRSDNMRRLEAVCAALPETRRVDVEGWGGEPTFRVRGKVFVFTSPEAAGVTVKLPHIEAEALVASDAAVTPTGYGLGRHGWVSADLGENLSEECWQEVEEWVRTSYTLVAPKKLAKLVEA
ncbi:MAG: MmcQ/YjbR family DNA-binding protein [Stackebrandtia sp.]